MDCDDLQDLIIGRCLEELPYYNKNEYGVFSSYSLFEGGRYGGYGDFHVYPTKLRKLKIKDERREIRIPYMNTKYMNYGYFRYVPLKEIYVGRPLTMLSNYSAFEGIETLEKVEFGGYCDRMYSLRDCINLKTLILGKTIKTVFADSISDYSLSEIFLKTSVPPVVDGEFSNRAYLNTKVYVPQGSLEAYQTAEVWKIFWNIIEWNPDDVTGIISVENQNRVDISVNGRNICIDNRDQKSTVMIYDAAGALIYRGTDDVISVSSAGLYIVCVNGYTKKLIIK